jgi:hypothetical protein
LTPCLGKLKGRNKAVKITLTGLQLQADRDPLPNNIFKFDIRIGAAQIQLVVVQAAQFILSIERMENQFFAEQGIKL